MCVCVTGNRSGAVKVQKTGHGKRLCVCVCGGGVEKRVNRIHTEMAFFFFVVKTGLG